MKIGAKTFEILIKVEKNLSNLSIYSVSKIAEII